MPVARFQMPDGRIARFEVPEGTTPEQAQALISQAMKPETPGIIGGVDPTSGMSGTEKFLAGTGKAMADLGRGVGQMVGAVSRDDVAQSRKRDAALMNTGAGVAGNLFGNVAMLAPAAMIPGANTAAGAGTIGAVTGMLQPSTSTSETMLNVGLGGVGGVAGQKIANAAPAFFAARRAAQAAADVVKSQKLGAAKQAVAAGYVIPPEDIGGGAVVKAATGLAGKIKTAQEASARNQTVTNGLIRKDLGIGLSEPLNTDTLKTIRDVAGQAYDKFRTVGTVTADKAFNDKLDDVLKTTRGAARSFPGLKSDEAETLVKTMRQPAFDAGDAIDATKVLRELGDTAYAKGDKQLGKAYKSVSGALEDALDRHLQGAAPAAVKEFRQARQLIAKTYTVERALNSQTGDVSAQVLAQQLKKGKPLSGGIKTVAQIGEAFPKATQALKEAPKTLSPLDMAVAAASSAGAGPVGLAGLVARPAVRNMLLSEPMQRQMLKESARTPIRNSLLEYLASEQVMLPAGLLSGTGAASALSPYLQK